MCGTRVGSGSEQMTSPLGRRRAISLPAAGSLPQAGALYVLWMRDGPGLCTWRGLLWARPPPCHLLSKNSVLRRRKRRQEPGGGWAPACAFHGPSAWWPRPPRPGHTSETRTPHGASRQARSLAAPPDQIADSRPTGREAGLAFPGEGPAPAVGTGQGAGADLRPGGSGPHVTGRASGSACVALQDWTSPPWGCSSTDSASGKGGAAPAPGTVTVFPPVPAVHTPAMVHIAHLVPSRPRACLTSAVATGTHLWSRDTSDSWALFLFSGGMRGGGSCSSLSAIQPLSLSPASGTWCWR